MPRSAIIAAAVLGVLVLFASTAFALVRSTQLRNTRHEVAELRSELARANQRQQQPRSEEPSERSPLDEFFGEDSPLDDLFGGEGGDGLEEFFGDEAQRLARCLEPAGGLGSRDVPSAAPEQQIDHIADVVTDLRSLDFTEDPEPQFLGEDEVVQRLTADIREEYTPEEAQLDARILTALGAVPAGTDLLQSQLDLITSQVAGFYDPDTGELVVRTADTGRGLDPTAQVTLAHELQHAVADQRLDLPIEITENVEQSDAALAALSLIEGDASLTQQQFSVVGLDLSEQFRLNTDPDLLEAQRQLDEVPHYLAQSLQFPYTAGLLFVCDRFLESGWDAVNATYDRLPTTSAEILDPARYGTQPADPRDVTAPGAGWNPALRTTVGAADLMWLFEAPGDDRQRALDDPRGEALAWTGGEMAVWTRGEATAIGIALTQRESGGPLCNAVATWYERAFPNATDAPPRPGDNERIVRQTDTQTAVVACTGHDVRLGIAPDAETARILVQ